MAIESQQKYSLRDGSNPRGRFTLAELRQRYDQGLISRRAECSSDGLKAWVPIAMVLDLPRVETPTTTSPSRDRVSQHPPPIPPRVKNTESPLDRIEREDGILPLIGGTLLVSMGLVVSFFSQTTGGHHIVFVGAIVCGLVLGARGIGILLFRSPQAGYLIGILSIIASLIYLFRTYA